MAAPHDTPETARPGAALARFVFRPPPGAPAAEVSEQIISAWREGWSRRPPALVLVPDSLHSGLVEHLLKRIRLLEPGPGDPHGLAAAVTAAVDSGATLVHGGVTPQAGLWQPTLIVNLDPGSPLLADPGLCGPVLAVARVGEDEAEVRDHLEWLPGELEVVPCPPEDPSREEES